MSSRFVCEDFRVRTFAGRKPPIVVEFLNQKVQLTTLTIKLLVGKLRCGLGKEARIITMPRRRNQRSVGLAKVYTPPDTNCGRIIRMIKEIIRSFVDHLNTKTVAKKKTSGNMGEKSYRNSFRLSLRRQIVPLRA